MKYKGINGPRYTPATSDAQTPDEGRVLHTNKAHQYSILKLMKLRTAASRKWTRSCFKSNYRDTGGIAYRYADGWRLAVHYYEGLLLQYARRSRDEVVTMEILAYLNLQWKELE